MSNPTIKVKRSTVQGKVPTTGQLGLGEIAINHYDGKVFVLQDTGGVGVGTTVISVGSIDDWQIKTSNYTASNGDKLIADTSGGSFTITLPPSPYTGFNITFADGDDWSNNNLTISRNGSTIEDISDNLILDVSDTIVTLIYDGSTWQVFSQVGAQGPPGPSYWVETNAGIHTLSNVGIGTTNPTRKLDVEIQTAGLSNGSVLNSHPITEFVNISTGGVRGLEIGAPAGGVTAPVYLKVSGTSNRFAILDQNDHENFTILDSGNVGIGTDNPQEKLHVSGTSDFVVDTEASALRFGSYGEYDIALVTGRNTPTGSSRLYIENGNGEALRITSGGVVQINGDVQDAANDIDTSNTKLTIKQSAMGLEDGIYIERPSERRGHYIRVATSGNAEDALVFGMTHWGTETDHLLALDRTGNVTMTAGSVGIGTDSPYQTLDVRGTGLFKTSGSPTLYIDADTDAIPAIMFQGTPSGGSAGTQLGSIGFGGLTSNELEIWSYGSIKLNVSGSGYGTADLAIDANGNVGIGTTNPDKKLRVEGDARITGTLTVGTDTTIINGAHEYPTIRPTLDLNFAATKTLDRRITFTRDSLGTYTDELGVLKYAPNNTPRFDHDPATGESLGLLIEESRTNFVTNSDHGNTILNNGGVTATQSNNYITPDGLYGTCIDVQHNSTTTSGYYRVGGSVSITSGQSYTVSFFVRNPNNHPWEQSASGTYLGIHLYRNGTGQNNSVGFGSEDMKKEYYPSGWTRYSATFVAQDTATVDGFFSVMTVVNTYLNWNYQLWGFQIEEGSFPTSYIPTSGSTATRAQDTAKITGTSFTDFYNETEGTLFIHADKSETTNDMGVTINNMSSVSDNRIELRLTGSNLSTTRHVINSGGTGYMDSTTNIIDVNRYSFAFARNNAMPCTNGTLGTLDTVVEMPVGVNQMTIGDTPAFSGQSTTRIRQVSYYNKRLPNAQLQGLTAQ